MYDYSTACELGAMAERAWLEPTALHQEINTLLGTEGPLGMFITGIVNDWVDRWVAVGSPTALGNDNANSYWILQRYDIPLHDGSKIPGIGVTWAEASNAPNSDVMNLVVPLVHSTVVKRMVDRYPY